MQYFKPAAGIIILVFTLLVLYNLIDSHIEEKQRQERVQETQRVEASRQYNLDKCIEDADYAKYDAESVARNVMLANQQSGRYDTLVNNCMSNAWVPDFSTPGLKDAAYNQTLTKCKIAVDASFMNQAEIDQDYQNALTNCRVKYGN